MTAISYREAPTTADERAIESVLEALVQGFRSRDRNALASFFMPGAILCQPLSEHAKTYLTSDAYINKFLKSPLVRTVSYRNVLIRTRNDHRATVFYTVEMAVRQSITPVALDRIFHFVKSENQWRVARMLPG